jgi:hypothetical protein
MVTHTKWHSNSTVFPAGEAGVLFCAWNDGPLDGPHQGQPESCSENADRDITAFIGRQIVSLVILVYKRGEPV